MTPQTEDEHILEIAIDLCASGELDALGKAVDRVYDEHEQPQMRIDARGRLGRVMKRYLKPADDDLFNEGKLVDLDVYAAALRGGLKWLRCEDGERLPSEDVDGPYPGDGRRCEGTYAFGFTDVRACDERDGCGRDGCPSVANIDELGGPDE